MEWSQFLKQTHSAMTPLNLLGGKIKPWGMWMGNDSIVPTGWVNKAMGTGNDSIVPTG